MASPFCQRGNPLACTCFTQQTPRRPDVYYNHYSSPSPQTTWANQYYPPLPPQAFTAAPGFNSNLTFQNTFPTSFNPAAPGPALPTTFRTPLGDATNVPTAAMTATAPRPRSKRKSGPGGENTRSRARRRVEPVSAAAGGPAVFGVGPPTAAATAAAAAASESVLHPSQANPVNLGSVAEKRKTSGAAATDVWFFVRGVHTAVAPATEPEESEMTTERPNKEEFTHLACRFCRIKDWTTWKNVDGQTKSIRNHLDAEHGNVWRDTVLLKQLKGWERVGASRPKPGEREEFSLPGFYERLVKWIAVDDQSLDVVDCPELRDLLLFIGAQLDDNDIPHRTKMSELISTRFQVEYQKMIHEIQNALGRVSFTQDIWSRVNLDSHLAITAHYIVKDADGRLVLKTRLVAFRRMEGSHTGENIGKVFVKVVKEIGCLHKTGMVTCDNAGNNNTGMAEIRDELTRLHIPFDVEGNRIRCFPHVVNIAVKTGLKEVAELPPYHPDVVLDDNGNVIPQSLRDNIAYWRALESDPVAEARSLVTACRASGQRREALEKVIREGNDAGGFGDPAEELRVVGLLKDVETRWSATFLMIDRLLEQYLAVDKFLDDPAQDEISWHRLSPMTLKVLQDIRRLLQIPHVVQEIVSAEKTPTLSVVLPMYEKLILMLKDLRRELDELSIGIDAMIRKLEEYLNMSRRTKVYSLAMVLNPTIKLQWLREHWDPEDADSAKREIRAAMLEYRKEHRLQQSASRIQIPSTAGRRVVNPPSASSAARAQKSGFARLNALAKTLSGSDLNAPATTPPPDESSEQEKAEAARRAVIEDERIVDEEIRRYEAEGILDESNPEFEDLDLVRYWEFHQHHFPYFFRVALDILPVQASAVPCERVFSSSKETDSLRRGSLSPEMMEMLQILKFIYRQDRISFCDGWVATERELSVIDLDPEVVEELLSAGRAHELEELVNSSLGTASQ